MSILSSIQKKISDLPENGSVVVRTDSESLFIKECFFKNGHQVVSDRDVFTLDYELIRHIGQTKGLRVVSDQLYPFLFESGAGRDSVLNSLDFVKNFPDPFVEPELYEVLTEFLNQEDSAQKLLKTLEETMEVVSHLNGMDTVPKGYANLFLNELNFSENTYFLSSLLDSMPFGFSDKFYGKSIKISDSEMVWKDQIELYENLKSSENIEFCDFDHQVEEVRAALFYLKNNAEPDKIAVLYPKHNGYEKLFYLYQREFFEDQIFFLQEKEDETISRFISKISLETKRHHTYYDLPGIQNKNKTLTQKINNDLYALSDLSESYFEEDFTELDLNIFSDIQVQLGAEHKLSLMDWKKIFEQERIKINKKFNKLKTGLKIGDYEQIIDSDVEEVWVLGWSDKIFKKTGDKIFSNALMSKIEMNLGLLLPSLSSSEASLLFKNPAMQDSSVRKIICHSTQSFVGGSNKPGVFKILMEQHQKARAFKRERVLNKDVLKMSKEKAKLSNVNLSASSLQRYEECPYKFYLEKVIGLCRDDDEDYFLTPKQEGSLMHSVLEDLDDKSANCSSVEEKIRQLMTCEDEDLSLFKEAAVVELAQKMWSIIQREKEYLLESNVVKTISEKFFSFDVKLETEEIVRNGGDFTVRGLVDRVDIDSNSQALIYDYKRGESGTHSLAAYKGSKLAPQLFLYCLAADQKLLGEFNEFVGFQYINLSLYKRQKGFVVKNKAEKMAKEIPARSAVDEEKYQEKMSIFMKKLWSVLEKIKENFFEEEPNAAYSGQCASCVWLGVCKKSETFI